MVRKKLRAAIETSGCSQHVFSARIGIATPNLNAFLKGTRSLPYPKFVRALDELALTIGPKNHGASIMPPEEMPEIFRLGIETAGMKIKDVSEQTGIDLACLSTFLNGSRTTPVRNIEKMMDVLGLEFVKLIRPKAQKAS